MIRNKPTITISKTLEHHSCSSTDCIKKLSDNLHHKYLNFIKKGTLYVGKQTNVS